MAIKLQGYVFKDDGTAVSGATVQAYDSADGSTEGTATTTNSDGKWTYDDITADGLYDIKITSGGSIRYRKGADKATFEELYIRNDTAATQSPLYVANATNNASVKVLDLSNKNSTRADGDEIYMSFNLNDSAGNPHEMARITAEAVDVTAGEEDGQIRFGVAVDGTMTDVFTINSSESAGTDMNLDVSGDLTLDADGGDIFFKDGGTTFGSATNNSGNLIIKSGTTTALTFSGANVTLGGTATVTTLAEVGSDTDKIIMSDSGVLKYVTGANLRSYIGAGTGDGDITGVTITADDTNTASDTAGSADFTVAGGSGLTSSVSGTTITVAGDNASTSAKGVAQFSSDNFAASSGTITIKDGGIATAEIADNQVTLAKMAGLARGKIIYGDASGDPAALTAGNANEVLTSDGTDISWAAASSGVSAGKAIAFSLIF